MTTERTTDPETSYADRVLDEVQISAACGLDPDQAREVAGSLLAGLAKMAKALEDATYAPGEYEKIARSAAHAMKSADGLVRLMEFASAGQTRGRTWGRSGYGRSRTSSWPSSRAGSRRPARRRIGGIARRRRRGASDLRATFFLPRRERLVTR